MSTRKSVAQEIGDKLAEQLLPIKIAGAAVGLEDHRRMLAQHARRVDEGHRAMAKAAGMEDVIGRAEDEMGDIIITGDISSPAAATPHKAAADPGVIRLAAAVLIAAGMIVGGLGGPLLYFALAGRTESAPPAAGQHMGPVEFDVFIKQKDGKWQIQPGPLQPAE